MKLYTIFVLVLEGFCGKVIRGVYKCFTMVAWNLMPKLPTLEPGTVEPRNCGG